jgi:acyl-CoA synthetase (AMP-forming)/AMP-acid ligase II
MPVPTHLTTWQWAFESPQFSPTIYAGNSTGYYENAISKERLYYGEVKDKATALSTALKRKYAFKEGDTVSLLATNTIWYPVALWATVRGGKLS